MPTEVRLDKWLWAARLFKTRQTAVKAVSAGHVEVNGNRLPCNDPGGEGWILKSENTIELIGQSCLDFKNNPQSMLHADFPCNVFVPE